MHGKREEMRIEARAVGKTSTTRRPVFVSHSSKDQEHALRLVSDLEKYGVKCWISCRLSDLNVGGNYLHSVPDAIEGCCAFLLVGSRNANLSKEVEKEIALASTYKKLFLPVKIESYEPSSAIKLQMATAQYVNLYDGYTKGILAICTSLPVLVADHVKLETKVRRFERQQKILRLLKTYTLAAVVIGVFGVSTWVERDAISNVVGHWTTSLDFIPTKKTKATVFSNTAGITPGTNQQNVTAEGINKTIVPPRLSSEPSREIGVVAKPTIVQQSATPTAIFHVTSDLPIQTPVPVPAAQASAFSSPVLSPPTSYTVTTNATMEDSPSAFGTVIETIEAGETVIAVGTQPSGSDWIHVQVGTGPSGYINKDFLISQNQ